MVDADEARKQASDYLNAHGAGSYAMRSCWNCNASHEHLKNSECPILCFSCGHWFFKGVNISIIDSGATAEPT